MASFIIPFTSIFWRKKPAKFDNKERVTSGVCSTVYPSSLWILTLTCKTEHSAAIDRLNNSFSRSTFQCTSSDMDWRVTASWQKKGYCSKLQPESPPLVSFWTWRPLAQPVCPQAAVKTEESWGAVQDEYARTIFSWGRTKRPSTGWAPAQHDTAGFCVSGFQSHWKSRQSTPEFLLVAVTKANSGLKWSDEKISERGNVLVCVFTRGLAQRFPGQDPEIWQMCKIMRNHYNLGCWETINRLNLFSNVISPNLTGPVMHAACCYTYSWLLSCDRLSAA